MRMDLAAQAVYYAIQLYIMLIFVWALGSWFPQWRYQSWYRFISDVVEPYIGLFRRLPLRFNMLDFTPLVAIFVLYLFQNLVMMMAGGGR
jgi:YggT family protein